MNSKKLSKLFATAALLTAISAPVIAGNIYTINYDGANIDLTGTIETNALGTFQPEALDALLIDYQITASENGTFPFVFTKANSTWGAVGNGSLIDIIISASTITLFSPSPSGAIDQSENQLLRADTATNGARENLRYSFDQLGLRMPSPPNTVIQDTVSTQFVLATAVDEPIYLLLLSMGLISMGIMRYRKRLAIDYTFHNTSVFSKN